jgi:hypothetical protein
VRGGAGSCATKNPPPARSLGLRLQSASWSTRLPSSASSPSAYLILIFLIFGHDYTDDAPAGDDFAVVLAPASPAPGPLLDTNEACQRACPRPRDDACAGVPRLHAHAFVFFRFITLCIRIPARCRRVRRAGILPPPSADVHDTTDAASRWRTFTDYVRQYLHRHPDAGPAIRR